MIQLCDVPSSWDRALCNQVTDIVLCNQVADILFVWIKFVFQNGCFAIQPIRHELYLRRI